MLTAKIGIEYDDGWTSNLAGHDVYAEWPASTFYEGKYLGVIFLSTSEFEAVFDEIRSHGDVDSVEVVSKTTQNGRTNATLIERERDIEETPMGSLLEEGFLPLRPTRLENGTQTYDLIFEDHGDIADAVDLLSSYGTVTTEAISPDFEHKTTPSTVEWQGLLNTITPAQLEIFRTAYEAGYFEIPRQVTLEEIGEQIGVTKATASYQLNKILNAFAEFITKYLYRVDQ
jgi:predicted DNA binding protein